MNGDGACTVSIRSTKFPTRYTSDTVFVSRGLPNKYANYQKFQSRPKSSFTPIIVADIRGSLLCDEIYPLPQD
jgi:hypothetical protein